MKPMIVPPTAPKNDNRKISFGDDGIGQAEQDANQQSRSQPGHGSVMALMTKPMLKRLMNAPSKAARLSGKERGIIEAAESAP